GEKKWKQLEQLIMDFYTKSVYVAIARIQNPNIISPTNNDLYLMQSEKVENPEIHLADPNLIGYSQNKKVDYTKSFLARHGLAVLYNNCGLLKMLEVIRQAGNCLEFFEQDQINIGKF
ncbi:9222_t:CDS:2, partial [Gigaspora margarita]